MRALLLAGIITIAAAAIAQKTTVGEQPKNLALTTKLTRVVVFKEGFGFYVREGQTKLEKGWTTTDLTPAAVQGTFWVYPQDKTDKVERLITTRDNTIHYKSAEDIKNVLADKIGLRLSVKANDKESVGKLNALLPNMMLLEENKTFTAVTYDTVQEIKLVGYPLRIKVKTPNENKVTTIGFGYVQNGVNWEPSYLLEMGDNGTGTLTMRGTLMGLPEAIDDVEVQFVVGAPMMSERGRIESLLMGFVSGGMGGYGGFGGGQMMNSQSAAKDEMRRSEPTGAPAPVPGEYGVGGEETGELFYYTAKGISMGSADVASISIFEHAVKVEPRFEWDADMDVVTYIALLTNDTGLPLTTGAVFVTDKDKPLGQAVMKYTPKGASAELRLARGVGMRTEASEVEKSREAPYDARGRRWQKVQIQGSLQVHNYRPEKAHVKVLKTVKGRIIEVGQGGKVKTAKVATDANGATSSLEWWVDVEPGKAETVTYTYEVIVSAEGP